MCKIFYSYTIVFLNPNMTIKYDCQFIDYCSLDNYKENLKP